LDTRPISAVMAIAAYQLPTARDYHPGMGHAMVAPPAAPDTVEISAEARQRAAEETEELRLWGEVRYDYPHTDDPDMPWEVQHQQWKDLMAKVFARGDQSERTPNQRGSGTSA
jgi:hypothetical protein